ncbi:EboA domain-containing protein [Negadavirga shengliensis]|uniref:EboA domain-containing protein n=1 Tax=Negadavirga shengliensis TaxID=1389218 RepID=A0ABV9T7L3_9BACT
MGDKNQILSQAKSYLNQLLQRTSPQKSIDWLYQQCEKINTAGSETKLFLAFSQASRHFSKDPWILTEEEIEAADSVRKGFMPQKWNSLRAARCFLLLQAVSEENDKWLSLMDTLFETADMHEQEALYGALPLLPFPEKLTKRASEGLRTNITSVFDAVALDNPYPADHLDEKAWNQLVLKAIFLQRPLYRIIGADGRANKDLANTLVDYVHERWSAGREVFPELWRFVGPYLDDDAVSLFKKVLKSGTELEKQAAGLALRANGSSAALSLLEPYPEIKAALDLGGINWSSIGKEYYKKGTV